MCLGGHPQQRHLLARDLGPTHFDRRRPETQARRLIKRLAELGFSVELKSMATAS
jgi:hypothetical protein